MEFLRENWVILLGILIIMSMMLFAVREIRRYGRQEREFREKVRESEKVVEPKSQPPD